MFFYVWCNLVLKGIVITPQSLQTRNTALHMPVKPWDSFSIFLYLSALCASDYLHQKTGQRCPWAMQSCHCRRHHQFLLPLLPFHPHGHTPLSSWHQTAPHKPVRSAWTRKTRGNKQVFLWLREKMICYCSVALNIFNWLHSKSWNQTCRNMDLTKVFVLFFIWYMIYQYITSRLIPNYIRLDKAVLSV